MKNAAYFLAMVTHSGEELVETSGIKRPVVKAKCYDSAGSLSEITLIFSEICECRKSSSLKPGDVIYFQAKVGECPKDSLVFYPGELHIIMKNQSVNTVFSEKLLDSKMAPFEREQNLVVFGGKVCSVEQNRVCIDTPKPEFLRGEVAAMSSLCVDIGKSIPPKPGDTVFFAGEVSGGVLSGQLYNIIKKS